MDNTPPDPEQHDGADYGDVRHPDERMYATILHLSAFSSLLTSGFGGILGPLIVWLIFRGRSDMVDFHGKKALNFQIPLAIIFLILLGVLIPAYIILIVALEADAGRNLGAAFWGSLGVVLASVALMLLAGLIGTIWTILAAVRANRGDPPGYLFSIPFFR